MSITFEFGLGHAMQSLSYNNKFLLPLLTTLHLAQPILRYQCLEMGSKMISSPEVGKCSAVCQAIVSWWVWSLVYVNHEREKEKALIAFRTGSDWYCRHQQTCFNSGGTWSELWADGEHPQKAAETRWLSLMHYSLLMNKPHSSSMDAVPNGKINASFTSITNTSLA